MSPAPDVIVIGAGAIGAACAHELASRGASVEVLDQTPGWALGCTAGNTGLIVPSHSKPLANPSNLRDGLRSITHRNTAFGIQFDPRLAGWALRFARNARSAERASAGAAILQRLAEESLTRWEELGPEHVWRHGYLNVYATEERFATGCEYAKSGSVAYEILEAAAAYEYEPALQRRIAGAILFPDAAHADPSRLVEAVGRASEDLGVRLRTGVTVRQLLPGGRVDTSAGVLRAKTVVLAAGVNSRHLGIRLPMGAGHGASVDVIDGLARPRLPIVLEEEHVLASPFSDRTRLAGTFEIGTTNTRKSIAKRRIDAMLDGGRRLLRPSGTWSARPLWNGSGPIAPDGMPIIGRLRTHPDIIAATAHSLLGITLAPATGRLVADLVSGGDPVPELDPARFNA